MKTFPVRFTESLALAITAATLLNASTSLVLADHLYLSDQNDFDITECTILFQQQYRRACLSQSGAERREVLIDLRRLKSVDVVRSDGLVTVTFYGTDAAENTWTDQIIACDGFHYDQMIGNYVSLRLREEHVSHIIDHERICNEKQP